MGTSFPCVVHPCDTEGLAESFALRTGNGFLRCTVHISLMLSKQVGSTEFFLELGILKDNSFACRSDKLLLVLIYML